MITAQDVERTFRTWLDLAKDEEVLTLAALVYTALRRRGYWPEVTFRRPGTEPQEDGPQEQSLRG